MRRSVIATTLVCLLLNSTLSANDWGDLRGRFAIDGEVPPTKTIRFQKDAGKLGGEVPDESLVVNRRNKGIANIAIYLQRNKKQPPVRQHPSYASAADMEVECLFAKGRFKPHLLLVRTSQSIVYQGNDDGVDHHPHFYPFRNPVY